jgi:tetratricopeptide (TPR) repeat protein
MRQAGFDPTGAPATPAEAVRGFLDALGVGPEQIPRHGDAQAGLYRSLLAGLAAGGARLLSLDILSHREAVRLLTARIAHARATAEPAAVTEIAELCAGLPLALAVAAARAAARPAFPLTYLAAELRDTTGRLDALDAGDPEARQLIGELARAHLISEHTPGRFAFHDLLRAYAAAQARDHDTEAEREAAPGRVLDHYLQTAGHGSGLLQPSREPIALTPPRPGTTPERLADYGRAMAWFEAEHHVMLAAATLAGQSGFDSHAWQLPWAMEPFLRTRGRYQEWAATQRTALAAAARLGDTAGQATSSHLLGSACTNLGDHEQARTHLARSLDLHRRLGNRLGEAKAHQGLAVLAQRQGRYADALGHAEQALRLYQGVGHKAAEAVMLNNVGYCHALLGGYKQARAFCRQALALQAEVGHRQLEGYIWDSLGYAERHLGNFAEAIACYERALSIARELGERYTEANVLTHLGDTRHVARELPQARHAWQQALTILEDIQHPNAGQVRARLDSAGETSLG